MFALRDFSYQDLETGGVVKVKRGDPVPEKVLNMHRDPEVLIRTRFVSGNDASRLSAEIVTPPKRKRGRPKKQA